MELIGDIKEFKKLNKIKITQVQANMLNVLACDAFRWKIMPIVYLDKKPKIAGKDFVGLFMRDKKIIAIFKDGNRVGCVLHEIAHHTCEGHGKKFRQTEKKLLTLYETKWQESIKE